MKYSNQIKSDFCFVHTMLEVHVVLVPQIDHSFLNQMDLEWYFDY